MINVKVNRETCEGYAVCIRAAESVFDLDDDGLVVLKQASAPDDLLPDIRQAAYDCPTESITFEED